MKIIQANLSDAKQALDIVNLLSQYAMDIMGGGEDLSYEVKQNLIPALENRNSTLVILAYENEIAVGLAICFEGFSTFYAKPLINIHDFVVLPNYRGKGIAKLMLDQIQSIAQERNCCKITLEVLEGNYRAQKVYKDFGFEGYELDKSSGKALFWDKKLI
jgi:ribosomal protein S18 acetylase RimI-like enzyme